MTSQAERKRRRRERNRIRQAESHGEAANSPAEGQAASSGSNTPPEDNRPTQEARMHGSYVRAEASRSAPWVNRHVDMIARLGANGAITPAQVEAARLWEEIYGGFRAELGIAPGRSCLDISIGGHDAGDGNPAAVQRYYALTKRLGPAHSARLGIEVGKGPHDKPDNLNALRWALDAVMD